MIGNHQRKDEPAAHSLECLVTLVTLPASHNFLYLLVAIGGGTSIVPWIIVMLDVRDCTLEGDVVRLLAPTHTLVHDGRDFFPLSYCRHVVMG